MTKEAARRWLKVPYEDKDRAKKLGAQWDGLVKMWYSIASL